MERRRPRRPAIPDPKHSATLDELLDELETRPSRPASLAAAHGRSIDTDDRECLRIRDRDGTIELEIRITAEGPRLSMRGAAIELSATRSVDVRCERFTVAAELGVSLAAERGDVRLDAGDDVIVTGERILLN